MAKCLIILASLVSGCATQVDYPIGLPPYPLIEPVTQELWDTVPKHAQKIWSDNDLAKDKYIEKLELRISIHDESL